MQYNVKGLAVGHISIRDTKNSYLCEEAVECLLCRVCATWSAAYLAMLSTATVSSPCASQASVPNCLKQSQSQHARLYDASFESENTDAQTNER